MPAAFAVVQAPSATKLASAEGKLHLMRRVRELTHEGEKILATLTRILEDGNDTARLRAAELLLSYGYGKPIETQLIANTSGNGEAPPTAALTSEQLEAVVNGQVISDAEIVPNSETTSTGQAGPDDAPE